MYQLQQGGTTTSEELWSVSNALDGNIGYVAQELPRHSTAQPSRPMLRSSGNVKTAPAY